MKLETIAVKTYTDKTSAVRPNSVPINRSTIFQVATSEDHGELFKKGSSLIYQRFGHPSSEYLSKKISELESGEDSLVFSSGMAAISTSLLAVLKPGDHVIAQKNIFAQTYQFLKDMLTSYGISVDFIDARKCDIETLITQHTKLIYIETPSNPMLNIIDIKYYGDLAKRFNIRLYVDSTFATPLLQKPLEHGASLVLHSGTKYFNGHNDVMCGFIVGNKELISKIREKQILLGGILDPQGAWLVQRGLKTLHLRVKQQCENAFRIANYLSDSRKLINVYYPFLRNNPYYDLAVSQMKFGGGMISFEVPNGLDGARSFLNALQLIPIATSLGGVETIIEIPYELDFHNEEVGDDFGVNPGLIRLSVGIENVDDLIDDLKLGLNTIK